MVFITVIISTQLIKITCELQILINNIREKYYFTGNLSQCIIGTFLLVSSYIST